jgi:hypothetical protein
MLDHTVETVEQSAFEGAEEPEPELENRVLTVAFLTVWPGGTVAGVKGR